MKKEIGLIIKMPTEQAPLEEIEYRKSKLYNLLAKWAIKEYLTKNNLEDIIMGVELSKANNNSSLEDFE